ncbi:hypothetical protein EJB05_43589, partial [Eragrostis curvula]
MAPPQSVFLRLLLLLLPVLAAAFAIPSPASPAQDKPPSDAAADKFLQACCAACASTTDAAVCYDSLLPHASSFEGNVVKVAGAATVIAYARLRSFDHELRSFLHGGSGSGAGVVGAVKSCVKYYPDVLYREDDTLAMLRRLETAAGRREEKAKSNLHTVNSYIGEIYDFTDMCMDGFVSSGAGVLASPVGKMMLAGNATVYLYGGIALDLVASIKL